MSHIMKKADLGANKKGSDQPAHPHSLNRTVVCCLDAFMITTLYLQNSKFLGQLVSE